MPPKKQKGNKMALSDFFADTTTGSWADEMDTMPSAPAARDPSLPKRGEPGYLDSMPDRSSRTFSGGPPPREDLPLPTAPPYTAFVGNLAFEVDEEALRDFLADLNATSVRIVKDPMGKPKGFGYVEFPDVEKLKEALGRSGAMLLGRAVRLSVAEAPATTRRDGGPSAAEEASQWRRSTPLPARTESTGPGSTRRQPSFNDSAAPGPERDWGAARGTKFTPAPPVHSGLGRENSGPGRERERERDLGPSVADEADKWRSAKPLVEAIKPAGGASGAGREVPPHQRGVGSGQSSPSLADTEPTWARGSKLKTPAAEVPPRQNTESPGEDARDWRSSRAASAVPSATSRQGSVDGESPRQPPAPLERRKLNLAPRSAPGTPSTTTSTSSPAANAKGIFGSAKPIDTAAREKEAEAKMAAREEERKKAREAEIQKQKDEADAGRKLAEEKAKMIKEAQQKALQDAGAAPPPPARGEGGAGRGGRGGRQDRRTSSDHPHPHPRGGHRGSHSGRGDATVPAKEDGFERTVARGPRAQTVEKPAPLGSEAAKKKESTTRPGFSFAAAAGLLDESNGANGADEGEGADAGVEAVTKGVEEVAV